MADNQELYTGSAGSTFQVAADDIAGVKHQRVKVQHGADGSATDVSAASPLPVTAALTDGPNLDAFSRLRTSSPYTVFDSKLLAADKAPLFWDEQLESGGGISGSTPTADKPYIDFTSTVSTAGVYTRQTFRRFSYQPGKSQLILMTGVLNLSGGGTGVERRIGYFDDDNGLFFEIDNATVGVTVRTSDSGTPVDSTTVQGSWNLDTMDGNGPSGITADWTKAQIFVIDFEWLSFGRVRFGLDIGGTIYYVHETSQANTAAIPYMSTPNLPLRYQMVTTASSPASTMRCVCSSVISEGGSDPTGVYQTHATTDHVNANTADVVYALVGIRLKSSALGCSVETVHVSVLSETSDAFEWQLILNPTVAGVFTFGDKTNSCVQTATGDTANPSTNTVTSGTIVARGFGNTSDASQILLRDMLQIGAAIDGTQDELVLCVRPLGANADIQGALTWREQF
jgi:hypothetical protein